MLWDESRQSWRELDVPGQPYSVLYSASGEELGRWSGGIPESDIRSLIS